MNNLETFILKINGFLWDYALLVILCGTGIYFTIRLKFIQIRKFPEGFKKTFGSISLKGETAGAGGMSSFQSLATSIAAQVGTGNLAGVSTALMAGGPGAIFWMWVSSFLGMSTIFAEATLAQKYKTYRNGSVTGGPAFYIREAFKNKFGKIVSVIFSILIILALGFMGNMVQSNSISAAFGNAFPVNNVVVGLISAAVAGFVFIGGTKRIASFTEKIVPIMAVSYLLGASVIILINIKHVPLAFYQIFVSAFNPEAIIGGSLGIGVQKAIRYGIARGLFSNEAGMGSTPHAHAIAKVDHPCEQGIVAMMGVFFTFIVLTLTALVILTSGILHTDVFPKESIHLIPESLKGIGLPQAAFQMRFGHFGVIFIAICLLFFAFSTIIAWYFFGETNVKLLFGDKAAKVYALIVVIFVFLGSILKVDLVWALADCFNGMMVIPNLLGVLALSGTVCVLFKEYEDIEKKKKQK